jgi:uncharacterized damage-inducible protein DinB
MSFGTEMLSEFDHEMATTRRVLERVPSEKATWKPHEKSFPIGHLAQLLSWMPAWIASALTEPKLDLASAPKYTFEKTETLLAGFDANVAAARAALEKVSDADLNSDWQLTRGDLVLMTVKRRAIVRMHLSHLVHHRGQMTVYLRLIDVPVPMVYGPTADERMPM